MSSYTANLGLLLMDPAQAQPHLPHNEALVSIDKAIAGALDLDLTGLTTLTLTGAESTAHILHVTTTTAACDLVVQTNPKSWIVINDGAHTVTVKRAAQTGAPTVAAGAIKHLVSDGVDIRLVG